MAEDSKPKETKDPAEKKPKAQPTPPPTQSVPEAERAQQILDLMNANIQTLTAAERVQYLNVMAQSRGLNPMMRPFDLIEDPKSKRVTVYANSGAADQFADNRKLSRRLVYAGPLCVFLEGDDGRVHPKPDMILKADVFVTLWRVEEVIKDKDGKPESVRVTYDMGANNWREAEGEGLVNMILRTFTKGDRRAVLGHCGVGLPDRTELDTIPTLKVPEGAKFVTPADQRQATPPAPTPQLTEGKPPVIDVTPPAAARTAVPVAAAAPPVPPKTGGAPPLPRKPVPPPVPPKPKS